MQTAVDIKHSISKIAELPKVLNSAVHGLSDEQLETTYREGGWTLKQVVHHIADSHMNAYIRMKLVLTEQYPTFKPYEQDNWAMTPDGYRFDIQPSLKIIEGMHARMTELLSSTSSADWERKAYHPESGDMTLLDLLEKYADHGAGHVKQITDLRERMGW